MNICVYIYILNSFLAFTAGSRPYWKLAFYNINDRVAYLNKVNLSIYLVTWLNCGRQWVYSFFLSATENIFDHRNFLNFVHENNVDNTILNYFW